MPLAGHPDRTPDETDQRIAGFFGCGARTRVSRPAAAIHLARSNAGQADARSFGAPDRPVAVPDPGRRASERLARGRGGGGGKEQKTENRRGPWCRKWREWIATHS